MALKNREIDWRLLTVLYGLAFLLLVEWLRPIAMLTETGHIVQFYGFVALCMVLGLIQVSSWIGMPLKVLYIIFSVQYVFYETKWLSMASLSETFTNLAESATLIWSGDWIHLSYLFRTVLFFILLWMISYLLRFWIEYRKSIFLFFVMTVLFLAVIETFTAYDASYAMLRVMIFGLLTLGLLYPYRLTSKAAIRLRKSDYLKVVLPLSFLIASISIVVLLLPIKQPVWPDPLPYIRSAAGLGEGGTEKGAGNGISKIGYDADDTQLGGPFKEDDTLVFEAYSESRQYWKMETKNTYTSKGWIQDSTSDESQYSRNVTDIIGEQVLVPPRKRADFELFETLPVLPYPYGFEELLANEGYIYEQENKTGRLILNADGLEPFIYQTEFVEPEYSLKALRETNMKDFEAFSSELDEYLQLPEVLPSRVSDLAIELTKDAPSVYQKAQAIERYFGRSGFVYTRENVAVPDAEEDYVDQFLFETKRGYCDNFSSSMVVLLRSAGIPARWVKGFAPGELKRDKDREKYYEVTNNQAHSWVEAYMPGFGWMPFEPTIGFNGVSNVNYDIDLPKDDERNQEEMKRPESQKKKTEAQPSAQKKSSSSDWMNNLPDWLKSGMVWVIIFGGTIALVAFILYMTRKKWIPRILVYRAQRKPSSWSVFEEQYSQLLKQFERIGIKKPAGMTLSEYANKVDRLRGDNLMSELTAVFEQGLYGRQVADEDWRKLREMWEDLIITTCG